MKIDQLLYGMQTGDGKISLMKTPSVSALLGYKNLEYLRTLKPQDSRRYIWFKDTQVIAYPIIVDVADKDPKHGGRTWTQNHTQLVTIHDFLMYTQAGGNPFQAFELNYVGELEYFPDVLQPLNV